MDAVDYRMISYESGFGTISALREWERKPGSTFKLAIPSLITEPIVMHTNLRCEDPGAPSTCVVRSRSNTR